VAEELKVNITGDASNLKGALDGAGGNVTSFSEKLGKIGKVATVAGVAVVAGLAKIVTSTAAVGDKFDKMSLRTGVAVEDLSALAYAADISGASIETIEKGLKGLTTVMDDASKGIGLGLEAFEELDIAVVDMEGNLRPTVDVLREAATKISAIKNPTKQAALAMDLFGAKAGPQLLPLLKAGEGGIADLMDKAKELGITMSTEAATSAAEFTDRVTDLQGSLAGAGRTIGEALIPAITPLIEKVTEVVVKISDWAKANPELLATITKVAGVIAVAAAVGGPILMMVSAFTKVVGAMKLIGTLTTGPIGLIILAVTGLALAWKTNFGGIQEKTVAVINFLKGLFSGFVNMISGIKDKIIGIINGIISAINKVKSALIGGTSSPTLGGAMARAQAAETVKAYAGPTTAFHDKGIDYVPRKAFYGLDPGERVLTSDENKAYQSGAGNFSPTININNPVVRNDNDISNIRNMIESVLNNYSKQQFNRQGNEFLLGV